MSLARVSAVPFRIVSSKHHIAGRSMQMEHVRPPEPALPLRFNCKCVLAQEKPASHRMRNYPMDMDTSISRALGMGKVHGFLV